MNQYRALRLGALPVGLINKTLHLELEAGDVWMSKAAHRHVARDHAEDYPIILPGLRTVIEDPTYAGQRPNRPDNFYLVRRFAGRDGAVLVAIGLERNAYGGYNLKSAYRISEKDVDRYRRSGHLKLV